MNWMRVADKGLRLFICAMCAVFTMAAGSILVASLLHGMLATHPRGIAMAACFFGAFGWCTRLMWHSLWED